VNAQSITEAKVREGGKKETLRPRRMYSTGNAQPCGGKAFKGSDRLKDRKKGGTETCRKLDFELGLCTGGSEEKKHGEGKLRLT